MEDVLYLVCGFPHDKVAFQTQVLYKDLEFLLQVSMQNEDVPIIKEFVAPEGKMLNIVTFEFRGSNILLFDSDKNEYANEVRIDRKVFLNGCKPMQVKIKSVSAGVAKVNIWLCVSNAFVANRELSFTVVDVDKESEKQEGMEK